jgi:Ca-activated chloride channel family protein
MTMTVGNQRVVAKIEERERAKRDFDKAKEEGKSASLLEEDRPNVFSMNVANILPRDTIAVELKYTELLVPTEATYELVYPTVVGPRYSSKNSKAAGGHDRFVETPYLHEGESSKSEFHLSAQLSTGVPLNDVTCATHQVVARRDGAALKSRSPRPSFFRAITTSSSVFAWRETKSARACFSIRAETKTSFS